MVPLTLKPGDAANGPVILGTIEAHYYWIRSNECLPISAVSSYPRHYAVRAIID